MPRRGGKFGPVKRQHGRVAGLDAVLDRVVAECEHVTKIVPGRFGRKRGKTPAKFKVQYETNDPATGLKCMYTHAGSWQEVFLVCDDVAKARAWVEANL